MSARTPVINEPEAGPSSAASSRAPSPNPSPDLSRPLRRPASHGRLAKLMLPGRSRSGSTASQAETPITAYADEVAPASGRTTPEQRWRSGKAATASLLASDAKYKKFAGQVDKCLQSFESVNEWADFISFLSRLLKTLQLPSPAYTEIPRKLIVAKRLAQCLNPALPSGVHQRALDVYSHILATIGPEGLRRDMLIWSSGLFPFFQFAATSVRPILLNIYEKYYLPLGEDLRPVTKAIVLALLPGMEEETGDFFDKVLSLLSRISEAVSPIFFLQNVFLVLLSSPSSRLAGINYLSKRLIRPPDQEANADVGLIMRGVAAVLEDENSLVRRGGLDLLLRISPLDGHVFRNAEETDRRLLLRAAIAVVLQRELSLSRRVFTWLLGTDESSDGQIAYFKRHALDILTATLRVDMEQAGTYDVVDSQRPFKVFLSLLDRWEVGAALSENLAVSSLEAIKHVVDSNPASREEFLVTASAVYDAVEPIIIWKALYTALTTQHDDSMLRWILANLPQKDEEITALHAPVMLDHTLQRVQLGNTLEISRLVSLSLELTKHAAHDLFDQAASPDADASFDLAKELYASATTDTDAYRQRVGSQAAPRVIHNIFKLAIRPNLDVQDRLAILELVSWALEIEAAAIGTIVGSDWMHSLVGHLAIVKSFALVDAIVSTAMQASQSRLFKPPLELNRPSIISPILDTLFRFLRPDQTPHHARAVELLWEFNKLAEIHTLENVIAKQMSNKISKQSIEAMEAFGTLWRLTDDVMLPGEIFYVPVLSVLDSLHSENPDVQRSAETWMRCNLKSYFRILDPVLSRLVDPTSEDGDVGRKEVDHGSVAYLLERVEMLFKYGGPGLSRECQATEVTKSTHPTLVDRARRSAAGSATYLDLLVSVLVHHLTSASPQPKPAERAAVSKMQSRALNVLQLLVSNGEISQPSLLTLRAALLDKLEISTKAREITLQNKLLYILHRTITLVSNPGKTHRRTPSSTANKEESDAFEKALAHVIIDGISSHANQGVLQHWVDFVLMITPSIQTKPRILHTLCDCFSLQTKTTVLQMRRQLDGGEVTGRGAGDAEVIMLLTGLERLVSLSGSVSSNRRSEDGRVGNEGGSGILGLVSGVFIADTSDDKSVVSSAEWLGNAIEALLVAWTATTPSATDARPDQMANQVRDRTRTVLEKMCKSQMSGIIIGCIALWAGDVEDVTDEAIFDCIDPLTPSAQRVVEIVSESVVPKQGRAVEANTVSIMAFLEAYLSRLEAPIAVQIWSTMFAFAKDMLLGASSPVAKAQLYPLLRCLTVLCKIVITTSALEDRRLRRELQDTYPKVLDAVVGNLSRLGEASALTRSPGEKANGYTDYSQTVCAFLSESVVPNLRSFLVDADKIAASCSTIWLNIVTPALKHYRADSSILAIVYELTRVPPAAKTWRFPVGDAFNDPRFFSIDADDAVLWKPLICSLMDTDKERFTELLSRITAAPSANIFTNREQEMITRSSNLRRLSFVLLAAEQNHYLAQLPAIQEKLVDILRTNVVSPRVHSEVYLCLRIIMCRISPQHLTNFWPVILAELLRVFEGIMDEVPADGSESLQLALAACKFLDLLLTMQSEDFQIHQWMFVTDTTDAVYPPEDFSPDAIMDTIAEILRDHRHGEKDQVAVIPLTMEESGKLRRPRLLRAKKINSMRELEPFFSRASIENFECLYTTSNVDWAAVEDGLQSEIFER